MCGKAIYSLTGAFKMKIGREIAPMKIIAVRASRERSPESEEEARKREEIEDYMNYILNTDEFQKELLKGLPD
jgi:DNA-binding transcriptional regulator GbsR (MarR family)